MKIYGMNTLAVSNAVERRNMNRPKNPYPINIFKKPKSTDYDLARKALKEVNLGLETFLASFARDVWENCCEEWERNLDAKL